MNKRFDGGFCLGRALMELYKQKKMKNDEEEEDEKGHSLIGSCKREKIKKRRWSYELALDGCIPNHSLTHIYNMHCWLIICQNKIFVMRQDPNHIV